MEEEATVGGESDVAERSDAHKCSHVCFLLAVVKEQCKLEARVGGQHVLDAVRVVQQNFLCVQVSQCKRKWWPDYGRGERERKRESAATEGREVRACAKGSAGQSVSECVSE